MRAGDVPRPLCRIGHDVDVDAGGIRIERRARFHDFVDLLPHLLLHRDLLEHRLDDDIAIADRIVEAGRLGQKNGKGWYRYEPGDRTPHPDPEVARIIKETAAELGIAQHTFTDEEILKRMLFASVNEACKILDEGKALRASDIDVMWLYGFGFPRYRGGLMFWADGIGVREVYNQIAAWHQRYGERWAPSPLLRRLADSGTPLREAKADRIR